MKVFVVLFFILNSHIVLADGSPIGDKKSYYINNQNDTVFGLIKLERKSKYFSIVKDASWESEKIYPSQALSFCKNGQHFVKQEYKGQTKFLEVLGDSIFQYHKKREKFYNHFVSKDIYWPDNNHPEMRYKYKVNLPDETLYVTRFNYQSILKNTFNLSDTLAENCHFYQLLLDIDQLRN